MKLTSKDWQIDFSFLDIDPIPTENLIIMRDELKLLWLKSRNQSKQIRYSNLYDYLKPKLKRSSSNQNYGIIWKISYYSMIKAFKVNLPIKTD